jgi:endonuclease IV
MELLIKTAYGAFDGLKGKRENNERLAEEEFILAKSLSKFNIKKKVVWNESHYRDADGGAYYFIYGNKLSKEYKEAKIKECIVDFCRKLGSSISFCLWLQQEIITISTSTATSLGRIIRRDTDLTLKDYQDFYNVRLQIGSTVTLNTIKDWYHRNLPVQVYLGPRIAQSKDDDPCCKKFCEGPSGPKGVSRSARVATLANIISKYKLPVYIHAPYNFNFTKPRLKMDAIYSDLEDGAKIGAKGVVIHVGKNKAINTNSIKKYKDAEGNKKKMPPLPVAIAVDRMRTNILLLLGKATVNCPLLLETPAAQGKKIWDDAGELLSKIEEMIEFYLSIPEDKRTVFGICVDTCHVYAAGYDPLLYLKYMESKLPGVIKLVHYNGSEKYKNSKRDLHYPAGGGFKVVEEACLKGKLPKINVYGDNGYIGLKRLTKIAKFCIEKKIPMVTE